MDQGPEDPAPFDGFIAFFVVISALIIGAMLGGCGMRHTVDPLEVKPITVNHVVDFDYEALSQYFEGLCSGEADPEECKAEKLEQFFEALAKYYGGEE